MITKSDILHTIEDKGETEIKSIIGYYITEIKRERPDLLLYEINELYKDVLKWSDFYRNMRESNEFLDFVKEQQRLFPEYSRGRDVKRYVENYNIALQIVTFLLPGDGNTEQNYYACDDSLLRDVFNLSSDIFNYKDENIFFDSVHKGTFSWTTIKNKARFKYIVYQLSKAISPEWYSGVCLSLNITKSECSSPYDQDSHKGWGKKIEKAVQKRILQ